MDCQVISGHKLYLRTKVQKVQGNVKKRRVHNWTENLGHGIFGSEVQSEMAFLVNFFFGRVRKPFPPVLILGGRSHTRRDAERGGGQRHRSRGSTSRHCAEFVLFSFRASRDALLKSCKKRPPGFQCSPTLWRRRSRCAAAVEACSPACWLALGRGLLAPRLLALRTNVL